MGRTWPQLAQIARHPAPLMAPVSENAILTLGDIYTSLWAAVSRLSRRPVLLNRQTAAAQHQSSIIELVRLLPTHLRMLMLQVY